MKQYPDFEFETSEPIDIILQNLPEGWKRDVDAERELGEQFRVLDCASESVPYPVSIFIFVDSALKGHVANILSAEPSKRSSMTPEEYVVCLQALIAEVLGGRAFSKSIPHVEITIPELLGPESTQKLRRFVATANKNSGSSHPRDRELWIAFIKAAARDPQNRLTADRLSEFLVEAGWSEGIASDLAHEYEFGHDLIKQAAG